MSDMSKHVLVSLWMHSTAGRRHLAGIYRYLAEKGLDWDIQLVKIFSDLTENGLRDLVVNGLDGVLTVRGYDREIEQILLRAGLPMVMIDTRGPQVDDVCVFSDDEAIGVLAAKHLLSYGNYRTFAYVPASNGNRWSYLRMKGFALQLNRQKRSALVKGAKSDLRKWLGNLEKPAAVFCASDATALDVFHAAAEAGIRIPDDMAVLGVDDDELICNNAHPALSSVRPGHEACGYAAAEILDRLFRKRKVRSVSVPPVGVTDRASITPCVPATVLVTRALAAIDEHATDGWGVEDVAKAVGISRRLLSLRFAALQGMSVHDALLDRRLAAVRRLLETTSLKIKDITTRTGFGNVNYLKRLFKERTGKTMREWRCRGKA